jgi:hypothetical protein
LYLYSNIHFISNRDLSKNGAFTRGIDDFFVDSNMQEFHAYLTKYLTYLMKITMDPLMDDIAHNRRNFDSKQSSFINTNVDIQNAMIKQNAEMKKDTIDKTNELKEKISKLIDTQKKNMVAIGNTYTDIYTRLVGYVGKLFNSLDVLQGHYNLSLITPSLSSATPAIKSAYENIYNLLTQHGNSEFIKKYFNIEKESIPKLTSIVKSQSNLKATTKASDAVTQFLI